MLYHINTMQCVSMSDILKTRIGGEKREGGWQGGVARLERDRENEEGVGMVHISRDVPESGFSDYQTHWCLTDRCSNQRSTNLQPTKDITLFSLSLSKSASSLSHSISIYLSLSISLSLFPLALSLLSLCHCSIRVQITPNGGLQI